MSSAIQTTEPARQRTPWDTVRVLSVQTRSPRIKSFFFERLSMPFVAGQHMDVRLTAPDGYSAQRSYSISSAPENDAHIELAIERLQDGEVSPFFHEAVQAGDRIDIRGPIGGHFVWQVADGGPVLLVGGGSGIAPLIAMLRHRQAQSSALPAVLVYSVRTRADYAFGDELRAMASRDDGLAVMTTLTREAATDPEFRSGRIDRALLAQAIEQLGEVRHVFICGMNAFVEHTAQLAVALGVSPATVRTERYGG